MKITSIEITHHRFPLDPPFRPSWDFRPREHFDATIVRVGTDEGLEGIGERFVAAVQCHPERTESTPAAFDRLWRFFVDACRGPARR